MLNRYTFCVFVVAAIVSWPCLLLDRPFDADHAVHFAKILSLEKGLLQGEGLFSWSHLWFGGYPTNINYPFPAYLIVIGIRWLSLGALSLHAAYAIVILLTLFTYAWAIFVLASQVMPRFMAVSAACLSLLDGGATSAGGYFWEMKLGVWPCKLAVALSLLSLAFYLEAFRRQEFKFYLRAAIVLSASLFLHPITLVFFFLVGPFIFVFVLLNQWGENKEFSIRFGNLALSLFLAFLGSLFWTGPFLIGAEYADSLGQKWMPLETVYSHFINFNLFQNIAPPISYLLVVGTLYSLFCSRGLIRAFSMIGLLLIIVASRDVSNAIFAAISSKIDRHVEFGRFILLAKPFFFIASAAALFSWLVLLNRFFKNTVRLSFVVFGLTTVVVLTTLWTWPDFNRKHQWTTQWLSRNPHSATLTEAQHWFCSLPFSSDNFFRVAFLLKKINPDGPDSHWLYNLNHHCSIPLFKIGFTPATGYRYQYNNLPIEALKRLAIKYFMTDTPQEHGNLRLFKQINDISIYEVTDFSGPSAVVSGSAKSKLLRWDQSVIEFDITQSKNAVLEIPVTDIGYWRASQNSKTIETKNPAQEKRPGHIYLVKVPVEDGLLRLEYKPPSALLFSSLVGLVVWISMIVFYLKISRVTKSNHKNQPRH